MDLQFVRLYLIELIGTFLLVFFTAGVVCVNHMTTPAGQEPATSAFTAYQPGLVGIAVAQGLALAALLGVTVRVSGGYLNPAIAMMLWLFNRLDTRRFAWFIGAQFLGAFLAGMCLHFLFAEDVARQSQLPHFGTPHVSPEAYGPLLDRANLLAGTGVELLLTFFLVFAIFSVAEGVAHPGLAGCIGGMVLAVCVLVGYPLTGAAINPARWFGTVTWELIRGGTVFGRPHYADLFVYVAGPILGALLAGAFYFKVYAVAVAEASIHSDRK